jgi:Rieske Fe-S protein
MREPTSTRRQMVALLSAIGLKALAPAPAARSEPADERPKAGDLLVEVDRESSTPQEPKDIPSGGLQVFAWPMDPSTGVVRKGSRLNKVLLLRLEVEGLTAPTSERAADGVVAYSALCPHAGCEVSGWSAEQKLLECSCHYSHYNPRQGAAIIDGPAPRPLPALPLMIHEGKLAVAKPFTARVGIPPT